MIIMEAMAAAFENLKALTTPPQRGRGVKKGRFEHRVLRSLAGKRWRKGETTTRNHVHPHKWERNLVARETRRELQPDRVEPDSNPARTEKLLKGIKGWKV